LIITNSEHYELKSKENSKKYFFQVAQRKLYEELSEVSKKIVFLVDTPKPQIDIPACLASGKEAECNQINKPEKFIWSGYKSIDLTNWFCVSKCEAIKEDYMIYRDASHISVAAANRVTQILLEELIELDAI
jgi:hypothetical protein